MKTYLDSVVIIYLVEQPPGFGTRASTAYAKVQPTEIISTDLSRMEVLILPRRLGNVALEADFERFLTAGTTRAAITSVTFDRALGLRAKYPFLKTPDSIHLSAAIDEQCDIFLTNDSKLARVTEIRVEVI